MFPLKHDHDIELEALDWQERPLFCIPACLHDLHGERARISAAAGQNVSRLRWGSPVRFWLEGATGSYEATGMVVGIEPGESPENSDLTLTLRLWELRPKSQQRLQKRRRTRLKLEYRLLSDKMEGNKDATHSEWQSGKTLDIGVGGLRFRTEKTDCKATPSARVEVRFSLPEGEESRPFVLEGNVLRWSETGKTVPALEIALKFDTLTLTESLALKRCL
ncbi:MAG: PilZ domain-containing protein [Chthonomonadaceae bacterium]|nr:PilZ domain-containing protein [Chthonomonadaceae bacterium]